MNSSSDHSLPGATAYGDTIHQASHPRLEAGGPSATWINSVIDDCSSGAFRSCNQDLQPSIQMGLEANADNWQWEQMALSLPTQNSFTAQAVDTNMPQNFAEVSTKRTASKVVASRRRKSRMRRSSPRGTPFTGSSTQSRKMKTRTTDSESHTFSYDGTGIGCPLEIGGQRSRKLDPQKAIALFEESIQAQPFSPLSQRKAADLINQLKQLILDEKKYGSPQQDASEANFTSTAPSSQISVSDSDILDSEYPTDDTSVSSTPRQQIKDTQDSLSIEPEPAEPAHRPCAQCGVKPLYHCTGKDCAYSTHIFADIKRHEETDKHWPQQRFMCLECPAVPAPLDMNGNSVCEFCSVPFSMLGGNVRAHYLQCASAKQDGTTFGRKHHLVEHLRKAHPMVKQTQIAATWKYAIHSKWPRQCGFCGIMFKTWDERMMHLADHFQKGSDMSSWKLPFPRPKDFRPGHNVQPKDDNSEDDDDSSGGNSRPRANTFIQQGTARGPPSQAQNSSTSGSRQQRSTLQAQYRSRASGCEDQDVPDSLRHGKPSLALERYLNDIEEPIAARLGFRSSGVSNLPKSSSPPDGKNIPKPLYQRLPHERVFCKQRGNYPDGFRGEHELRRHQDRNHQAVPKKWICIEPPSGGGHPKPVSPLSGCKSCSQVKRQYSTYYSAAAHLRDVHFKPKSAKRSADKRGANGGNHWPFGLEDLKSWTRQIEEPVPDKIRDDLLRSHCDTFKWIFGKSETQSGPQSNLSDRIRQGNGVFWINGKAGYGKSTLMRYLVDDPRTTEICRQILAYGPLQPQKDVGGTSDFDGRIRHSNLCPKQFSEEGTRDSEHLVAEIIAVAGLSESSRRIWSDNRDVNKSWVIWLDSGFSKVSNTTIWGLDQDRNDTSSPQEDCLHTPTSPGRPIAANPLGIASQPIAESKRTSPSFAQFEHLWQIPVGPDRPPLSLRNLYDLVLAEDNRKTRVTVISSNRLREIQEARQGTMPEDDNMVPSTSQVLEPPSQVPLIFMTHSLSGLIVKEVPIISLHQIVVTNLHYQAMLYAKEYPKYHDFLNTVRSKQLRGLKQDAEPRQRSKSLQPNELFLEPVNTVILNDMLAGAYAHLVARAGSSGSLVTWEEKDWKRLSASERIKILDEHLIHKDRGTFNPHPVSKSSNTTPPSHPKGSVYDQRLDKLGRATYSLSPLDSQYGSSYSSTLLDVEHQIPHGLTPGIYVANVYFFIPTDLDQALITIHGILLVKAGVTGPTTEKRAKSFHLYRKYLSEEALAQSEIQLAPSPGPAYALTPPSHPKDSVYDQKSDKFGRAIYEQTTSSKPRLMESSEALKRFINDPDSPRVLGQPKQGLKPLLPPIATIYSEPGPSSKDEPVISNQASCDRPTSPSTSPSPSILSRRESESNNTSTAPSDAADSLVGNLEIMSMGGQNHRLPCLLREITRCPVTFRLSEWKHWYSHSLSHYGDAGPPSHALCIFCHTVFDSDPPFTRVPSKEQDPDCYERVDYRLCTSDHEKKCLGKHNEKCSIKAMASWTTRALDTFFSAQWMVQVPVFQKIDGDIPHQDFDENVIMPYVNDFEMEAIIGGFSKVWKVKIHPAHQNLYGLKVIIRSLN